MEKWWDITLTAIGDPRDISIITENLLKYAEADADTAEFDEVSVDTLLKRAHLSEKTPNDTWLTGIEREGGLLKVTLESRGLPKKNNMEHFIRYFAKKPIDVFFDIEESSRVTTNHPDHVGMFKVCLQGPAALRHGECEQELISGADLIEMAREKLHINEQNVERLLRKIRFYYNGDIVVKPYALWVPPASKKLTANA